MSYFRINGRAKLTGAIPVFGSKNAAMPLLAASLLTGQEIVLHNMPAISDVQNMLAIMQAMGVHASFVSGTVQLKAKEVTPEKLPADKVGLLRGSILLMGALLGRTRQVKLPKPGGDLIGARPIAVHLDAFAQLGAKIDEQETWVSIDGRAIQAGQIVLGEASVTATENALLLAATLPGETIIKIAATEPHVVALAALLEQMGATITGAGTHTITIQGNPSLQGATVTNIPDMLEAGSFIAMAAATQSALTVQNVPLDDLVSFFKKIQEIGIVLDIDTSRRTVHVEAGKLKPFTLKTMPHPGMATDLQAPFSVLATQADGTSLIHDPMYEGRFRHINELQKMGARVTVCDPHRVIIHGPTPLTGQRIPSLDLRSGMTLLIAGLVAEGETIIDNAEIIDRGYADLAGRLRAVGADITRVD